MIDKAETLFWNRGKLSWLNSGLFNHLSNTAIYCIYALEEEVSNDNLKNDRKNCSKTTEKEERR